MQGEESERRRQEETRMIMHYVFFLLGLGITV